MSGIMIIDNNLLNKIKITDNEINDFEEFNEKTQYGFYYLIFRIFSDKYTRLTEEKFKHDYDNIMNLYDFLFYYKNIIDTFDKQAKKDLKKCKNIKKQIFADPLMVFLICLRNYIEHNPFNSIKTINDYTNNKQKIILKVSDIYQTISRNDYLKTLKFLNNNENKINVFPLIITGYNEILDYIEKVLYEYYDKNTFKQMYNLYKKLKTIELEPKTSCISKRYITISYGLDMYKAIVIDRSYKSNSKNRIKKKCFKLDIYE